MSIKAMTWVWDNSKHSGSRLLLLLAIADHCNDDGECYPGVTRLAKKSRLSHSHTQTLIRELKESGEITVLIQQGIETGTGQTNIYHLNGYRQSIGITRGTVDNTPVDNRDTDSNIPSSVRGTVGNTARGTVDNTLTISSEPSEKDKPSESITTESLDEITTKAARKLIAVYKTYSKNADSKMYGWAIQDAKELTSHGITPEHIKLWYECKSKDKWTVEHKNGVPTWNMLVSEIVSWRDSQSVAVTPVTSRKTRNAVFD